MRHFKILVLLLALVLAPAVGADQRGFTAHDCLGATANVPRTLASGSTTNGNEVGPLGNSSEMSGFVTFTGSGTLTITVQTRRARGGWTTPTVGNQPVTSKAAGAYSFSISIPPCDALRLVYTVATADIEVTDAFVLEQ